MQKLQAPLTRRSFIPRMTAATLGAGALLGSMGNSAPVNSASSGMKYRTLGRTGISVSEIGFGSHVARDKLDDEEGRTAQIRRGLELGITLFDIYEHSYGQFGLMSEVLGPVRQDVVISLVAVWGGNRVMDEIDFALETFNTDVIDMYRIYTSTSSNRGAIETSIQTLQRAKDQGKVRAIGLTAHDQAMLVEMLRTYSELDYLFFPYNLFYFFHYFQT